MLESFLRNCTIFCHHFYGSLHHSSSTTASVCFIIFCLIEEIWQMPALRSANKVKKAMTNSVFSSVLIALHLQSATSAWTARNTHINEQQWLWASTARRKKWLGGWLLYYTIVGRGHIAEATGVKCSYGLRHKLLPSRRTKTDFKWASNNAAAQRTA